MGVGRCCPTLLVVSTGLKGGRLRRDHVSGCSRGDRQVLSYPACSFGGAQGVGGGAEIMFRGARVGVGGCLLTLLVVSAGLKGGRLRRDHVSGCSSGVGRCCPTPLVVSTGLKGGWWCRDHVSGCSRGIGRCCPTLLVVSAGLKGGRLRRDHVSGCSRGETQVFAYPACSLDGAQGRAVAPRLCFGLFEWAVVQAKRLIRSTSSPQPNSRHDQHGPHRRARQDTHPDHAQQ